MTVQSTGQFKPEFRDPQAAFEDAIEAGKLSKNPEDENFAGAFMYMFSENGFDSFKHKITRQYLVVKQGVAHAR